MDAVTSYRWHELSLVVHADEPAGAGELAQTLQELSWECDDTYGLAPALSIYVHQQTAKRHLPETASRMFQAEGFWGFECGGDCYLTDGLSQWHLQLRQGRGEAWLGPDFLQKPAPLRRRFWAFGVLKLLRPLGLFSLHAAAVVSTDDRWPADRRPLRQWQVDPGAWVVAAGLELLSDDAVLLRQQPDGVEALACRRCLCHAEDGDTVCRSSLGRGVSDGAGGCKRRVCPSKRPSRRTGGRRSSRGCCCSPHRPPAAERLAPHGWPHGPRAAPHPQWPATVRPTDDGGRIWRSCKVSLQQTTTYELQAGRDLYEEPLHAATPPARG